MHQEHRGLSSRLFASPEYAVLLSCLAAACFTLMCELLHGVPRPHSVHPPTLSNLLKPSPPLGCYSACGPTRVIMGGIVRLTEHLVLLWRGRLCWVNTFPSPEGVAKEGY